MLVGHAAVFGEEDVEAVNGTEEADERSDGDDGFGDEHAAFEAGDFEAGEGGESGGIGSIAEGEGDDAAGGGVREAFCGVVEVSCEDEFEGFSREDVGVAQGDEPFDDDGHSGDGTEDERPDEPSGAFEDCVHWVGILRDWSALDRKKSGGSGGGSGQNSSV